jgi:hypothetical protein
MGMGKHIYSILIFAAMLFIVNGCSTDNINEVYVYEMEGFAETKKHSMQVITDSDEISIFTKAFKNVNKTSGIVNMADPNYKVEIGKETYFLWVDELSGTIMNAKDTHTTYTLSKENAKEINQVLLEYF